MTVVVLLVVLSGSGSARAADPLGGFQFQSAVLTVDEAAGQAVITVERPALEAIFPAQVGYITSGEGKDELTGSPYVCGEAVCTATSYDFTAVKGQLTFAVGDTQDSFSVPITDHGTASVPRTVQVSLYAPSTSLIGLGTISQATLVILENDPSAPRDPQNPLALTASPRPSNPTAGASFFVDPQSNSAAAALQYPQLSVIAEEPGTQRFGTFSTGSPYVPDIGTAVSRYLTRAAAQEPGTVPLLSTYRVVDGHCGNWSDPVADQQSYHDFIESFAQGIGSYRAVLFLEMDSIITMSCLSPEGQTVREHELEDAINILTADCPHLVIYLDAGAADALTAPAAATFLERSGVSQIQGFFVNSTHFDWTLNEISYGEAISRLIGGKHFVVNTAQNGQGPLRPPNIVHDGAEVLCDPAGRGLGPRPTSNVGYPNVDMFAWIGNPGVSGGPCVPGAPAAGDFWPQYALMLVHNANFDVTGPPPPPAREIRAALATALTPTGKAGSIPALLRKHSYSVVYTAPSAGRLRVGWYFKTKTAKTKNSRGSPRLSRGYTLLARGTATYTFGEPIQVTLRLSRRGTQALRKAGRLRVTLRASFTPTGGPAVAALKRFILAR